MRFWQNCEDMKMRNIENTYVTYDKLVTEIGEEVIENRLMQLQYEMQEFIKSNDLSDKVFIHEMALTHAVMDYFSDIQRLKEYHEIEHANEMKIKAYETYWILKRKPLQLKAQLEDDKWLYINEKFLLTRLASFMLGEKINIPLNGEKKIVLMNFFDTLYYYLKFRKADAQSLELMLLGFMAGKAIVEKE